MLAIRILERLAMSYADNWLKWFHVIERGASGLSARMLDLAHAEEAVELLDVGTGIGEPAITAATYMQSFGRVTAIDRDPVMIGLARARARARGVDNIDFIVADIDSLGLASSSMDTILARWSLMFVGNLPAVMMDLARILRPGGYLAVACWSTADKVPALSLAKRAAFNYFDWTQPPVSSAFNLADNKALKQAFAKAGFCDIQYESVPVIYEYDSVDDYIQNRIDLTGPLWDGMESTPGKLRREAFGAIEAAAQSYRTPAGSYRFENQAYCMTGCKQ